MFQLLKYAGVSMLFVSACTYTAGTPDLRFEQYQHVDSLNIAITKRKFAELAIGNNRGFREGYVPIGRLWLPSGGLSCKAAGCTDRHQQLIEAAAAHGADAADLSRMDTYARNGTSLTRTSCAEWSGPITYREHYCPPESGASCRYVERRRSQCLAYHYEYNGKRRTRTRATGAIELWRYAPKQALIPGAILDLDTSIVQSWLETGGDVNNPLTQLAFRNIIPCGSRVDVAQGCGVRDREMVALLVGHGAAEGSLQTLRDLAARSDYAEIAETLKAADTPPGHYIFRETYQDASPGAALADPTYKNRISGLTNQVYEGAYGCDDGGSRITYGATLELSTAGANELAGNYSFYRITGRLQAAEESCQVNAKLHLRRKSIVDGSGAELQGRNAYQLEIDPVECADRFNLHKASFEVSAPEQGDPFPTSLNGWILINACRSDVNMYNAVWKNRSHAH